MSGRWTGEVRREVLPNGLTLLAQAVPGATAVASVCHVRAGFFDEPDRLTGVSHVLEHMLFKGTPTRGVGAIAREMKGAGGYLNAGTGYDHTVYYAVLPPESLAAALDLQADAIRRSLLDAGELTRELQVIIEEAKRKLDTPSAVAAETLHTLLFDQHRIRRWRIGTEAQLAGLSHGDVVGYYRSRYVPERSIVAMAGALDPGPALAAARECYEGWTTAASALDPSPTEPLHHEVRGRTLRGDVRQADLALGWRSVPALDPDAIALDLAALVLGSGRASWLYRELRATGIVSSIGAGHFAPTEVGVFSLAAQLDPARLEEALERVADCMARLRTVGPSTADLARARTLVVARWARRLQTAEGRASALAAAEALGGVELLDQEYEHLLTVGADAVRAAAEKWLRDDSVAAVAYLPDQAGGELDTSLLRRAFRGDAGPAPPEPPLAVVPAPLPRPAAGNRTAGVLHVRLPGADLLLAEKPGVPLVSLGLYRRRSVADTPATAGLAALAIRAAIRGAGDFEAATLALAFEQLGGTVTPVAGAEWFGFTTSVLSTKVLDAAGLLDLVMRVPRYQPEELALERAALGEEVARAADDMLRYPMQLALRAAFGDSGYGLPILGLPESVPALTDGMVRAWHACELAAGRTLLVAVGELEPERLAERLAGLFEATPARGAAPPLTDAPGALAGVRTSVVERAKRQTGLAMLFRGPTRNEAARFTAEVWCAIASGLGGRLFSALREERSLAYSVFASSWQRAQAGALLLYLATSPEREEEAREALLGELARFAAEPPAPDELGRAVSYLSGQIAVERQTAGAVAAEIADAWLVGTGLGELADPAAGYRGVTAAAVRELAAASFDPEARAEGIVRGR